MEILGEEKGRKEPYAVEDGQKTGLEGVFEHFWRGIFFENITILIINYCFEKLI